MKLSFSSFQGAHYVGMAVNNPQPNAFWPALFLNLGLYCSPVGVYYNIDAPAYGALSAQDEFYVSDGSSPFLKQQAATTLSILSDPGHVVDLPLYSLVCN